jgi:hypothetical protein
MRYIHSTALIVLALAGCVAPQPAPVAPPAPVVRPARLPEPAPPPLTADWNDWPFTPGTWFYAGGSGKSRASFGTDQLLLAMECERANRQVVLTLIVGANSSLVVRTTTLTRELPTQAMGRPTADKSAMVYAQLSSNDPLLDAIAFSRGRFVIEQAGQPPLVLPPYAEIGRVIEDCRG